MGRWSEVLHLQGRSRRNALQTAGRLRRRRADAAAVERFAQDIARIEFLDAARAHYEGRASSSPHVIPTYDEAGRHPADRLLPSEMWTPGQVTLERDDVT